MRKILFAALLLATPAAAQTKTVLFVGNSFTYGEHSPVHYYKSETVTDLNGPGPGGKTVGGVPALFKAFAKEAGLDYAVSVETVGGKGLDYHYTQKLPLLDKAWDVAVLQSYSTLDEAHPGNPALLVQYAKLFSDTLHARNPNVQVWLNASWSRPDLTYPLGKHWSGKSIQQMAADVYTGYRAALKGAPAIKGVIPVGMGFNRAIQMGVADANPYDGISQDEMDLWAYDHYHASAFGYYLEALIVFGDVTGKDPLSLGIGETVADDMGFSIDQTHALQQIAHDELESMR